MSKEMQSKCSECGGKGFRFRGNIDSGYFTSKCSTCCIPEQTEKREAVKACLGCRFAAIIEKQDPHGYELCPEAIDDLADQILSRIHHELLSDVEKRHILDALQKLYGDGDEWYTCCEEIVRKLALDKEGGRE